MVRENGKFLRKKQPYYANNLERLPKPLADVPGPGFYFMGTYSTKEHKEGKGSSVPSSNVPAAASGSQVYQQPNKHRTLQST